MREREFTRQEIFDAVERTKMRMNGEILELHKKLYPTKSGDELFDSHEYFRGVQAVNHVKLTLSYEAGFHSTTMKDKADHKDTAGLKPESSFGNTNKVISTMISIANSKGYQEYPIARVGMEVLAEELGIKQQYLAAKSTASRNNSDRSPQ